LHLLYIESSGFLPEITTNNKNYMAQTGYFYNLLKNTLINSILMTGVLILISCFSNVAKADIYSFVTVDGVETFTDAPVNKQARVILKDNSKKQSKKAKKSEKQEKVHTISLDEIVEKTVRASHSSGAETDKGLFEAKLPPVGGTITSGVGMRIDPIDGKLRHHNGIDIAIREGTPITPVAPGIVIYSGLRSGYGYTLLIEHANGMVTLYGHNSRLLASAGQMVDKDTVVALSGNTGRSTGPHLHFEAWQSGVNVTAAFSPGSTMQISNTHAASYNNKPAFRKELLADGSILFTNTPSTVR
jgi:murein DD-endopeptidase MepM/ murein hydrolase activator NlpD